MKSKVVRTSPNCRRNCIFSISGNKLIDTHTMEHGDAAEQWVDINWWLIITFYTLLPRQILPPLNPKSGWTGTLGAFSACHAYRKRMEVSSQGIGLEGWGMRKNKQRKILLSASWKGRSVAYLLCILCCDQSGIAMRKSVNNLSHCVYRSCQRSEEWFFWNRYEFN